NVRNWMSYRSIKTEDQRDFRAIMQFVGLEDQCDDYWRTMALIDSAHRKAGQHIRRLLMKQILTSDLQDLEKLGRMDFELEDAEGVSLAGLRVKNIYPQTVSIHISRIGHPLELDGTSWLE
ncbi:hypothetical protein, partial [Streptococcus pseudopneumoniae]|uniref:hypothetical protein n=1 Tax=Streptococcus pseudopneumoniae TaxID=257758 RepID=UPI001BB29917